MLFKAFLIVTLFHWMVVADSQQPQEVDESQPELFFGQQSARFMALRITKTTVRIITVTDTSVVTPVCASLAAGVTQCRRRKRSMDKPVILSFDNEDNIDLFHPSPVQAIETTQVVSLSNAPSNAFKDLESSSESPIEVEIVGLQNDCVGRRFGLVPALVSSVASGVASAFPGVSGVSSLASSLASSLTSALNLTLRFTTTLTATATSVTTVTGAVTKTFGIANCTPSPFLYTVCK